LLNAKEVATNGCIRRTDSKATARRNPQRELRRQIKELTAMLEHMRTAMEDWTTGTYVYAVFLLFGFGIVLYHVVMLIIWRIQKIIGFFTGNSFTQGDTQWYKWRKRP
jgi:hypothetical protein